MGLWMSESVSQSVRDVCISHQSDWIYYKQPIKFLFVKVNGFDRDTVKNGHIYSSLREEEIFIYWVNFHIFCGLG